MSGTTKFDSKIIHDLQEASLIQLVFNQKLFAFAMDIKPLTTFSQSKNQIDDEHEDDDNDETPGAGPGPSSKAAGKRPRVASPGDENDDDESAPRRRRLTTSSIGL